MELQRGAGGDSVAPRAGAPGGAAPAGRTRRSRPTSSYAAFSLQPLADSYPLLIPRRCWQLSFRVNEWPGQGGGCGESVLTPVHHEHTVRDRARDPAPGGCRSTWRCRTRTARTGTSPTCRQGVYGSSHQHEHAQQSVLIRCARGAGESLVPPYTRGSVSLYLSLSDPWWLTCQ